MKMILQKHFRFSRGDEWISTVLFEDRGVLKVWKQGQDGPQVERWFPGWADYTVCICGKSMPSMLIVVEEVREVVTRRGGNIQQDQLAETTNRVEITQVPEELGENEIAVRGCEEPAGPPAIHTGKQCCSSNVSPIVGNMYELVGSEPQSVLTESEYMKLCKVKKLTPNEQETLFACISVSGAAPMLAPLVDGRAVHEGIKCDKTQECPIIGPRYHLMGSNFDVSEKGLKFLNHEEKQRGMWVKLTRAQAVVNL